MNADTEESNDDIQMSQIVDRLNIDSRKEAAVTLATAAIGVVLYVILTAVPWPYTMVSLFKLGVLPSLAIISTVGAIRGPIAGFLTGYVGEVLTGLLLHGTILLGTATAAAFGVCGLIVGILSYDFGRGKSLGKLSFMSAFGFVLTTLLVTVLSLFVEVTAPMAAIGFLLLPYLTVGLPTMILFTPVYARIWHLFMRRFLPSHLK
jgi:energy-coupling factor transport system substrate-specific component